MNPAAPVAARSTSFFAAGVPISSSASTARRARCRSGKSAIFPSKRSACCRISAEGLAQATQQNIKAEQLQAFLKRATNNAVPKSVTQLIDTWSQAGAQSASLSRLVVLRLPTPELLETLMSNPAVRRYLGAALGPAAVAVRADQWEQLASALQANGIMVEVDMG